MPRTQAQTQIQQEPQIPTQTCKWQSLPNQRIVEKRCPCAPPLLISIHSTIRPTQFHFLPHRSHQTSQACQTKRRPGLTQFYGLWCQMPFDLGMRNIVIIVLPPHSSPTAPPHHPSFQSCSKQTRNQLWYASGPHTLARNIKTLSSWCEYIFTYHLCLNSSKSIGINGFYNMLNV